MSVGPTWRSISVVPRKTSYVTSCGAAAVKTALVPACAVAGPLSVSVPVKGAVTLTVWVVVAPLTVSLTGYFPGAPNVCWAVAPVAVWPSPKSQL